MGNSALTLDHDEVTTLSEATGCKSANSHSTLGQLSNAADSMRCFLCYLASFFPLFLLSAMSSPSVSLIIFWQCCCPFLHWNIAFVCPRSFAVSAQYVLFFWLFLAYHLHIHCRCHIKWNVYVHAMQVQKTASAGKPVATIRISVRCTRCSLICFANLVDYLYTFYVLLSPFFFPNINFDTHVLTAPCSTISTYFVGDTCSHRQSGGDVVPTVPSIGQA